MCKDDFATFSPAKSDISGRSHPSTWRSLIFLHNFRRLRHNLCRLRPPQIRLRHVFRRLRQESADFATFSLSFQRLPFLDIIKDREIRYFRGEVGFPNGEVMHFIRLRHLKIRLRHDISDFATHFFLFWGEVIISCGEV
jgi:hypothetical protein